MLYLVDVSTRKEVYLFNSISSKKAKQTLRSVRNPLRYVSRRAMLAASL